MGKSVPEANFGKWRDFIAAINILYWDLISESLVCWLLDFRFRGDRWHLSFCNPVTRRNMQNAIIKINREKPNFPRIVRKLRRFIRNLPETLAAQRRVKNLTPEA